MAAVPKDILARTAAFLLLKDSRSSYAIEGERPSQDRIQRWGRAIGEAGRRPIDREELLRLQRIVIGDERFIRLGFRDEGGFVGDHDRDTRRPLPNHISARPDDLPSLVDGLIAFDRDAAQALDPVVAAAVLAFGFVYIHPFADGNGRLHRYLIHHVLAERGFNPPGIVFPVSAAILEHIDDYRAVLESYSTRLLPWVQWEPTESQNVRVLNDTVDFYRYFDATPHVAFLYACVEQDRRTGSSGGGGLPEALRPVPGPGAGPDRNAGLHHRPGVSFPTPERRPVLRRARAREFAALADAEAERIEAAYQEAFDDNGEIR